MASALNKRQQARNERTLQELIKTVPGNSTCADCGARNPGWASWSLGIFLCMRCATLHRKLGTHISKVKSLSMDKWDNAQVDNMKRIGNVESNKAYNPRNVKPQIPIDVDEVDSAIERYIRQKYEQRIFLPDSRPGTRQNTGSNSSVEDRPPPLPPKPTKRFGFGLQKSSTFPRNVTPPVSPGLGGFSGSDTSPPRVNKPSRVFGSNVNTSGDGLESKLATLRDMGFPDEKRNATALKGVNGNLDRAVETLIRLGEQGSGRSRGTTPTPPAKPGVNGITVEKTNTAPATATPANPFDALDQMAPFPQQQSQAATLQTQQLPPGGSYTQPSSPSNPYNPFIPQTQHVQFQHQPFPQQQSLEQSLQGLQLSNQQPTQQPQQPQQPLFPNRTGGYGQPQVPQYPQTNPFHQSFTPPPMPQIPQQYSSPYQSQHQSQQQPQQQYQSLSNPTSPGNPFLKSSRSQIFSPSNSFNSNPFGQIPSQQQQQQQQQPQSPPQYQTPNPFMQQQQMQPPATQAPNPWQNQQAGYQQPSYQQAPGGYDKNSIMALYNQPQLAPQRTELPQTPPAPAPASGPIAPAAGNMNPFAASQTAPSGQSSSAQPVLNSGARHVSNESVDFAGLMGGRHSPDAFSGLSSSFRR